MKRSLKIISLCILLLILVAVLSTLISAQTTIPKPKDIPGTVIVTRPIKYEKGKYGGTFINADYSGDPKTFNVAKANETSSTGLIYRFLTSLMTFDYDTGKWRVYVGDESKGSAGKGYDMEVKGEKQILTFYLAKDVFWSDGKPMTADDWVYYYNEIECNEDIYTAGYPGTMVTLPNGEEVQIKAEKIDKYTFRLVYPRVMGEPELQASFAPMPKHIIEPVMKKEGVDGFNKLWGITTPVKNLIGNGPWLLEKYEQNVSTIFKKNDRYFKKDEWSNKLPYIDKIINKIVADLNTTLLLFQSKEVDMYSVENKDFQQIVKNAQKDGYTVWNGGPTTGFEFVSFNQNPNSKALKGKPQFKWFTSKEFRTAMSFLIDRENIITQIFEGLAEPDITYFHKASPYFDKNITFDPEYNVKKATEILEKIGIRDRNGNGVAEDNEGNEIKFELLTNSGNSTREKIISNIAKEWGTYGIKATPTPIDFNVLVGKLMDSYDWESVMIGLTGGSFPLSGENVYPSTGNLHLWYPKQGKPATKWEEKVDDLFYKAKYEPNFKKRKDFTNQMFAVMYEEMPFIPLIRKYSFLAIYNKWQNVNWDVWADIGDDNQQRLFVK